MKGNKPRHRKYPRVCARVIPSILLFFFWSDRVQKCSSNLFCRRICEWHWSLEKKHPREFRTSCHLYRYRKCSQNRTRYIRESTFRYLTLFRGGISFCHLSDYRIFYPDAPDREYEEKALYPLWFQSRKYHYFHYLITGDYISPLICSLDSSRRCTLIFCALKRFVFLIFTSRVPSPISPHALSLWSTYDTTQKIISFSISSWWLFRSFRCVVWIFHLKAQE